MAWRQGREADVEEQKELIPESRIVGMDRCNSERWKPIIGYEDFYWISDTGKVWSVRSNRCLKPILTKAGYLRVHLSVDGVVQGYAVHRLVAIAFVPNTEDKPTVNHLNEIKTDNRAKNLEWATTLEQNIYGTRLARAMAHTDWKARSERMDYKIIASKHNYHEINRVQMIPVAQYSADGIFIAHFDGISEAARAVGTRPSAICMCLQGERKSGAGFQWRYYEGSNKSISPIKRWDTQCKPVICLDKDGNFIRKFQSVKSAAEDMGIRSRSLISRCLSEGRGTCGGYRWQYA